MLSHPLTPCASGCVAPWRQVPVGARRSGARWRWQAGRWAATGAFWRLRRGASPGPRTRGTRRSRGRPTTLATARRWLPRTRPPGPGNRSWRLQALHCHVAQRQMATNRCWRSGAARRSRPRSRIAAVYPPDPARSTTTSNAFIDQTSVADSSNGCGERSGLEERIHVCRELVVVLPEEAVRGVRIDLDLRVRDESSEQV